ncbi:MAG: hypothetical protein AUI14_16415 [Actinobacteria bacterium 13_2_20CM_2_71_6]|nr:MAG: hypothetical protein AUI14_16415 [Actinobacteria bacterium 13_2_20CM_2_71_6]
MTAAEQPRTAEQLAADLDDLEDDLGYEIEAWLPQAAHIEREAEVLGEVDLVHRARLVQADVRLRKGQTLDATPTLLELHSWATEHDRPSVLARSHLLLSRTHRVLGDPAASLEHAVCAVELLDENTSARRRVSYLIRLADALSYTGSFDAAAERYAQAERLAVAIGDAERQILALNNLAYYACTAGQEQLAFAAVERLRAVAAADGRGLDHASSYLDTIAQVELTFGRYAEARRAAQAGIELYDADGYEDAEAAVLFLLTLAMAQRHLGETGSAQHSLDRCRQLCDERDLAMVRIQVQQEQAELYAACGDLGRAFETYKAFHQADKALVSEQREARARTRQALFETTEARREADQFREQARRDPLTGMWNRRYMDEHLTTLIEHPLDPGMPLVAAIVDLDHFKRINDTRSHQAGDRVLVEVAGLLTAAVPTSATGFSARLGGEEFVVVLTGIGPAQAVQRLEKLRRTVAAHAWQDITGDLPVTISIGVAIRTADSTQSSLLGRADAALYAAKHNGRNRVHVEESGLDVDAAREISHPERRRYR